MTILSDLDDAIDTAEALAGMGQAVKPLRLRMGEPALMALAAVHPQRPPDATREWRPDRYRGFPISVVGRPHKPGAVDGQDGKPHSFSGWQLAE